jgi:hypothetical protein
MTDGHCFISFSTEVTLDFACRIDDELVKCDTERVLKGVGNAVEGKS